MFPPQLTLAEWGALAGLVGGVVTALAWMWKRVLRPHLYVPVVAHFQRFSEMSALFEGLVADIGLIKQTLEPNGGKSLVDIVRRTELSVKQLALRQRMVMSAISMPVFEVDKYGALTDANRAFLAMLDTSREGVLGNEWINLVHLEDRDRVLKLWNLAVQDKRTFLHVFRYRTRDGVVVNASVEAHPVRDDAGTVVGWFGTVEPLHLDEKLP